MYRSYVNALSISIRNLFTYIVRCAVVELCLTQRANPNLQGSKPKSCATRSAIRHCTQCRPRKGGTGIPVAGHPTEPYPSRRSRLDYLGSNSCTLFINYLDINNIDKTQNYIKIAFFPFFFFFFSYLHVLRQFLIDISLLFWSKLHRAVARIALCAAVRKSGNGILHLEWECADMGWNI